MVYVAKNPNERMSRQAIETLNEVEGDVKHGDMIHAFNRRHITDGICPTLTTRPEGFKTASLVVEGMYEKESDDLVGIKRCDATLEKVRKFYEDNGCLPKFYNPYNNIEIYDVTPTLTANCDRITNSATVLVFENGERESDNLTDLNKRYDADEQADFTQTEAEEWAAEIAIRIQEGNLDPIPTNKPKKFEQYDFTYASLFSGIGGFEQALNKLGGTCVFASEFDKFATQSYTALYGDDHLHGDITKIDEKDVPEHDLLVGGFPCQSFSVAGKREGFEDTRGTLFFDIARIAAEKKPKALLLENVKGLVNHDKGRTLDTMIETLNDIGYIVDFDVLNSKYFGVPQNRERIFIVAIREDLTTLAGGSIEAEPFSEKATTGQTIVPRGKRRIGEWAQTFNFDWPEQSEVITRLRDILESEVDEKYYLDEERTARLVAQLNETLPAHFPTPDDVNNTIRTGGKGSLTAKHNYDHIAEPQMLGLCDFKGNDAIRRVYSAESDRPTLTTMQGGHQEPKTATAKEGRYRIRKLTPKECWRLQNFPDEAFEKVKAAGMSDSQLYKQAGNAVTVSVVEAIGKRLIPFLNGR